MHGVENVCVSRCGETKSAHDLVEIVVVVAVMCVQAIVCVCVWVHEVSANLLMTTSQNQLIRSTERERFVLTTTVPCVYASTGRFVYVNCAV